jgi:hypothetical protein
MRCCATSAASPTVGVSSFAALVKDEGYVLVFPPSLGLNATGFALIALFTIAVLTLRASARREA